MKADEVYELIRREKIVVIIRGVSKDIVVDIAEALYEGGSRLVEITCNTAGAADMIKMLCEKTSGRMAIGAGTVLNTSQCSQVLAAGAEYIIAPNVNTDVIKYAVERDVAVIPGAATATEVLTAADAGAKMVKIFPAAALGAEYIRYLKGPIDNVDFMAVGGIRLDNIKGFMKAGCVAVGIGGQITQKNMSESRNWPKITEMVREYVKQAAAGSE